MVVHLLVLQVMVVAVAQVVLDKIQHLVLLEMVGWLLQALSQVSQHFMLAAEVEVVSRA